MKIWAFVAEIFAKQYWCFLIIDFRCIFDISAIMHLKSHQRWVISEWLWNFFKTICPDLTCPDLTCLLDTPTHLPHNHKTPSRKNPKPLQTPTRNTQNFRQKRVVPFARSKFGFPPKKIQNNLRANVFKVGSCAFIFWPFTSKASRVAISWYPGI